MFIGVDAPVSPRTDGPPPKLSHITLTDRDRLPAKAEPVSAQEGPRTLAPHGLQIEPDVGDRALDLVAKYKGFGTKHSFLGLPLDLDPASVQLDDGAGRTEQCKAVMIMARYSVGDQPARLHYGLACIWARDARLRGTDRLKALGEVKSHLRAATNDEAYDARWRNDPDFGSTDPAFSNDFKNLVSKFSATTPNAAVSASPCGSSS